MNKIFLVDNSFGGAAAAVALAKGAPATGAILLDPAVISREAPAYLSRIQEPALMLGAEEAVSNARKRGYFDRFGRSGVADVSIFIKDTIHEDAHFSAESTQATAEQHITFMRAMTSDAFSLPCSGTFDHAWVSLGDVLKIGRFFNPKKK